MPASVRKKPAAPPAIYARIPAEVHREPDGTYWAKVPLLPGCYTRGDTLAELESNLQEAVELYLDGIEDMMAAPPGDGHGEGRPARPLAERVSFELPAPPRPARKKSS